MTTTPTTHGAAGSKAPTVDPGSEAAMRDAAALLQRRRNRLRSRDLTLAILTPLVLLLVWELLATFGVIDRRLFTPPSDILARGWELATSGQLWPHLLATVLRLLLGLVIGSVTGVVVGLAMGLWRPLRSALGPTFTALYALPKIAILPLLLLIFGLTETPKVLSVAISVFFVIQINTVAGIVQLDPRVLEAARAYHASGWKLFRYVLLPGAMPSILTGLRVSAGMAVIVVTAVEFVASNNGLGYLIWNSWQLFQPATMFVGLIVVSVIGALITAAVIGMERLLLPWKYASTKRNRTSERSAR